MYMRYYTNTLNEFSPLHFFNAVLTYLYESFEMLPILYGSASCNLKYF